MIVPKIPPPHLYAANPAMPVRMRLFMAQPSFFSNRISQRLRSTMLFGIDSISYVITDRSRGMDGVGLEHESSVIEKMKVRLDGVQQHARNTLTCHRSSRSDGSGSREAADGMGVRAGG